MHATGQTSAQSRPLLAGRTVYVLLLLVFVLAAGVRVAGLVKGAPEYQPVRQYHSALIARYLDHLGRDGLPAWKSEVVQETAQPIHEPPLMEGLAVLGKRILGSESLQVPRAFAALAWLAGGALLFLLLRRYFPPEAALVGTAFYLFIPSGVRQSLSFQPDALMLALGLASALMIHRYYVSPTGRRLLSGALVCALAILLKTQIVFLVVGVFLALGLRRLSLPRLMVNRRAWLFGLIAVGPAAIYVTANMLLGGIVAQRGIVPAALLEPGFYVSWLYNLDYVLGFPTLILAGVGLLLLRGDALAMQIGLWAGYVLLGVVFTFHFATHSYYHMAVLPAAAFGIASLATPLVETLGRRGGVWRKPVLAGVAALALVLAVAPVLRSFGDGEERRMGRAYAEIGEKVGHSTRVLMLTRHEGFPLMYHGWLSGWLWPNQWIRAVEEVGLQGIAARQSEQHRFTLDVGRRFEEYAERKPEFFVITDLDEFENAPELGQFLAARFPLVARGDRYLIYDLRAPLGGAGGL